MSGTTRIPKAEMTGHEKSAMRMAPGTVTGFSLSGHAPATFRTAHGE